MTHVVIIGGGPAGLVTAACLADHGVPFTILERGATALAALRELDPEMQLLTPPAFSRLPGMKARPGAPPYERFDEVVEQFEAWRAARGLEVTPGVTVDKLERAGDGLTVGYRQAGAAQVMHATHVVNATGIISHPTLPADFDPEGYARPWQHSLGVRSAELAAARRLVVIGAGMSAAEVLERWLALRGPGDRAWLSSRKPVCAAPSKILGIDIHWFLWAPELVPGRLFGRRIGPERDLIIGRSILGALRDGSVTCVASVAGYERDGIVLAGGTRLDPDLLVFATGFRYGADHVGALVELDSHGHPIVDRHSASTRAPNLYVLGLRFGRSVASSALRGIVRDAAHVARRIARVAT